MRIIPIVDQCYDDYDCHGPNAVASMIMMMADNLHDNDNRQTFDSGEKL